MNRFVTRGVSVVLVAGLVLWPLHGLAEKGFGDFSAPPAERPKPRPKPPPLPRSKPAPRPQPPSGAEPRGGPGTKPAAGPAPAIGSMVRIPAGCFQMGSPEGENGRDANERLHQVCVQAFELGRYEVTVGEFRRFVSATGYRTDAERGVGGVAGCFAFDARDRGVALRAWADWRSPNREHENRDEHPVSCVSWSDATAYIGWLNRAGGGGWRLPTEAEWEYAARAGTQTTRYWGDDETAACRYANVADRRSGLGFFACEDGYQWVAPVGRFKPNPWGLQDMMGNVKEWTCSAYDEGYRGGERECAHSDDSGGRRVLRGSSWFLLPKFLRSADRLTGTTDSQANELGFRLARTLPP